MHRSNARARARRRVRPSSVAWLLAATLAAPIVAHGQDITDTTAKIRYKGLTLTPIGYFAGEAVFRSHNETADIGSSFNAITLRRPRLGPGRKALVRRVARMTSPIVRQMRSSSSDGMASRAASSCARSSAPRTERVSSGSSGSKRAVNDDTSRRTTSGWRASVDSTYCWLNGNDVWRTITHACIPHTGSAAWNAIFRT